MSRYNANKIPYAKQDEMLDVFCRVIYHFKTESELKNFLKDLLNRQERVMLIRRFLIADLLVAGKTYREIQDELHVGATTIARVDRWLTFGREGYLKAVSIKKGK